MAEYYAVLSRAIGGLNNTSPETRRAVYDKARNALIGQLKAISPALPTTEISRQRLELEEAIRRVEREIQAGTLPLTPRTLAAPPPQATIVRAPPPPEAPPAPSADGDGGRTSPQDIFRRAIQDAENRTGQSAPPRPVIARSAPPDRLPPLRPVIERPAAARPLVDRVPPPPPRQEPEPLPEEDAEPDMGELEGLVPPLPQPRIAPSRYDRARPSEEPRLAPDYDYEPDEEPPAAIRPPMERPREMRLPAPLDSEIDDVAPTRRGYAPRGEEPDDDQYELPPEPAPRRRSMAWLLVLLLILVTAAGIGYIALTHLATIRSIVASFEPTPKPAASAAVAVPAVDPASSKNGDRLLPPDPAADRPVRVVGDAATTGSLAAPTTSAPPTTGSTPSGSTATAPQAAQGAAKPAAPTTAATAAPGTTTAPPAVKPPTTTTPGTQPQASLSPPATTTLAPAGTATVQKATLYEEPSDPALAATSTYAVPGTVTWSYSSNTPDGPEVTGIITIPGRNMSVKLTIRRNKDGTLPASHMVELQVTTPPDFPGKSVQSVPTLVLKTTEDARGDVLVGASATVAAGYYWIALSSAQKDITSNLGLLHDRAWLDIRLVYQTGQRAIITLEKGPTGNAVFAQAISAWQTG